MYSLVVIVNEGRVLWKPIWLLELAFLLLPVSLVAETNPEGQMDAYRNVSSDGHAAATTQTSEAHPIDPTARASAHQATLKGHLVEGGVSCPLFRSDDGKEFSMVVDPEDMKDLKLGDRVELTYSAVPPLQLHAGSDGFRNKNSKGKVSFLLAH